MFDLQTVQIFTCYVAPLQNIEVKELEVPLTKLVFTIGRSHILYEHEKLYV